MASEDKVFEVEFTEECIEEMADIYDYISIELKEDKAAKRLISNVNERGLALARCPELYMKIGKVDKLKRDYHRMVIKN